MRDKRFVAIQRGGLLDLDRQRLMTTWAADCAEHVLPLFANFSSDDRPLRAINAARAWSRGESSVGDARRAALGAHDAARAIGNRSAAAVARAAGHAAATAHMADHCLHAAAYALKAVQLAGRNVESERAWQADRLSADIREVVLSAS